MINILSKIKTIVIGAKTKIIIYGIGALIASGLLLTLYLGYKDYQKVKLELVAEKSNVKAYENIVSGLESDKRVLSLSASDLKNSNDKMVHSIDSIRKLLKTPPTKPGDVSAGVDTNLHAGDTTYITNIEDFKLDTVIVYNKFTVDSIKIKKNMLITALNINNSQTLLVYTAREYSNKYKNGWCRFWHFDWKKEDVDRYDIDNTNKLIKVTGIRVIKTRE